MTWTIIGVDPAPLHIGVWDKDGGRSANPSQLRELLGDALSKPSNSLIVAWDAPLAFNEVNFYIRRIDQIARTWKTQHVEAGHFAEGAVSILPFCGVPHWAISCSLLGLPFHGKAPKFRLLTESFDPSTEEGALVVEVHPAVALGFWWLDASIPEPFPRYKRRKRVCRRIADMLSFPQDVDWDDNILDAYVAWKLGTDLIRGEAVIVGTAREGYFLLPSIGPTRELQDLWVRNS